PRDLSQTCSTASPQREKTLTLYAALITSSKCPSSTSQRKSSNTFCVTSNAGSTSKVTRVTTPSAPSPTTAPSNASSPRPNRSTSPDDNTSSSPATAVARFPLPTPEPCVAVAIAPPTEMCGSDARLCRATPA